MESPTDSFMEHFFDIDNSRKHEYNEHISTMSYGTYSHSDTSEDNSPSNTDDEDLIFNNQSNKRSYNDIISIMYSSKTPKFCVKEESSEKSSRVHNKCMEKITADSFEERFKVRFPMVEIDNIKDAISVWTLDYQVGKQIYPRMCDWEAMNRAPNPTDYPSAHRQYEYFKSLYESWAIDCNKSYEDWWYKYGMYQLKNIHKIRKRNATYKQKKRIRLNTNTID
ncbi:unnamed protein product [Dimorphilus gyrociliatus]|uniref:Uncharacterized protein n=1 Tax=Dimorphilus gyrociliatus TaxID=2664684 RepID=A0A7I8VCY0_9ANNE|nr:unnamed protein product [Dimorphilus gyrociliatus]